MTQEQPFKFGSQSLYKMTLQGKISDSWNDQIGPLKITQEVTSRGDHKTTLLFSTKDQAELMGFLNTIYEMHMPILSLKRVQKKQDLHLKK